jgi:hypothetical protein
MLSWMVDWPLSVTDSTVRFERSRTGSTPVGAILEGLNMGKDDLIEQLRIMASNLKCSIYPEVAGKRAFDLLNNAANEIVKLREELNKLKKP